MIFLSVDFLKVNLKEPFDKKLRITFSDGIVAEIGYLEHRVSIFYFCEREEIDIFP